MSQTTKTMKKAWQLTFKFPSLQFPGPLQGAKHNIIGLFSFRGSTCGLKQWGANRYLLKDESWHARSQGRTNFGLIGCLLCMNIWWFKTWSLEVTQSQPNFRSNCKLYFPEISCEYLNLKEISQLPTTQSYLWYSYNDQIHTRCFMTHFYHW